MSDPAFRRIARDDERELLAFLHADPWVLFALPAPDAAGLSRQLDEGAYVGETDRAWWIDLGGKTVGLVRVMDFGATDSDPQLAIRILPSARGRGIGRAGTRFATERVFSVAHQRRFEAQTRVDNLAMRRTLVSCGWVLEACYRSAWPTRENTIVDSVGYAILRSDWERGEQTAIDWAVLNEQDA